MMRQITKDDMHRVKEFLMTTTNGMAIGLFGTLIIGTILSVFADIPGLETVGSYATLVKSLMGAGKMPLHCETFVPGEIQTETAPQQGTAAG